MKYILTDEVEWRIDYGRYSEYLETIRDTLPPHVYQFASNEEHFVLNSPHSLHDSWLNSVEIREKRGQSYPQAGITLKLLGQCHDRTLILDYQDVYEYQFKGVKNTFNHADTFHGDVITHEVRMGESSRLIHELIFRSESTVLIECKNFTHSELMIESPGKSTN